MIQSSNRNRFRTAILVLTVALPTAGFAQVLPQTPPPTYGYRGVGQNLPLGGNYYQRPIAPPLLGNAAASGTLDRGLSLRTSVTIVDPNVFRGSLGSSSLGAFRRDAVSVGDSSQPLGGLAPNIYYDPATTVSSSVGFLQPQGTAAQQALTPGAAYGNLSTGGAVADQRLDLRLPAPTAATSLQAQVTGFDPGGLRALNPYSANSGLPTPRNTGLSTFAEDPLSGLAGFGARQSYVDPSGRSGFQLQALQPTLPEFQNLPQTPTTYDPTRPQSNVTYNRPQPQQQYADGDLYPDPTRSPTALPGTDLTLVPSRREIFGEGFGGPQGNLTALEQVQRTYPNLATTTPPAYDPRRAAAANAMAGPQFGNAAATPTGNALGANVPFAPGNDLFTDLQIANSLQGGGTQDWYDQLRGQILRDPTLSQMYYEQARMDSDAFVAQLNAPIRTFAKGIRSNLNERLARAEALLDQKQFFEAVAEFEQARLSDPENPLPVLGAGHAKLAAGDFMSAAFDVLRGVEAFPDLVNYDLDLVELLGGGEVIDIRRSELYERLAARDDARLRFLLGYLEFYGGRRESGMKNFERAAQLDQNQTIISRFPILLQRAGATDGGASRGAPLPRGGFDAIIQPDERETAPNDRRTRRPDPNRFTVERDAPTRSATGRAGVDRGRPRRLLEPLGETGAETAAAREPERHDVDRASPANSESNAGARVAPRRGGLSIPPPKPVQLGPK